MEITIKTLRHGTKTVLMDSEDYDFLMQWNWSIRFDRRVNAANNNYYAQRCYQDENGKTRTISMHRLLMNPPRGLVVDHINGNGLDNRRCNLRICTQSQNMMNSKPYGVTSKYKGVQLYSKVDPNKKYKVLIGKDGKSYFVGYFPDEVSAALAYNEASKKYHGEYGYINRINQ